MDLEKEIADLKKRLYELEKGGRVLPTKNPNFPTEDPQSTRCWKCGSSLSKVTGYVCGDLHCPIFPKVICKGSCSG